MFRLLSLAVLLAGLSIESIQAQNRAPVRSVRRHPTERVSPVPGVVLPAGASQRTAEPVPAPTEVNPTGVLPLPVVPTGEITAGPFDSVQVEKRSPKRTTPAQTRKRRP